ncbi:MAG: hypothetical protein QOG89_2229, partial [Thermomicrobiales bacterium]|nr:hypothetical protein [Thermomicrobiales bacterium]
RRHSPACVVVRLVLSRVVNCRQVAPTTLVADPGGPATKVHAKLYVHEPEIILTIDLVPTPDRAGAIGSVERSEWAALRRTFCGDGLRENVRYRSSRGKRVGRSAARLTVTPPPSIVPARTRTISTGRTSFWTVYASTLSHAHSQPPVPAVAWWAASWPRP